MELGLKFIAPDECKHYSTGYSLKTPEGKLFGEKVWCDIKVEDPNDETIKFMKEMDNVPKLTNLERVAPPANK